jgi:hypothetical protein
MLSGCICSYWAALRQSVSLGASRCLRGPRPFQGFLWVECGLAPCEPLLQNKVSNNLGVLLIFLRIGSVLFAWSVPVVFAHWQEYVRSRAEGVAMLQLAKFVTNHAFKVVELLVTFVPHILLGLAGFQQLTQMDACTHC